MIPGPGSSIPATALALHLLALSTQQIDRFVHDLDGDVQSRTKTNGMLAGFQNKKTAIENAFPKFVPGLRVGQVEGNKQTAPTHGADDRLLALQLLQRFQEML